MPDNSSKTVIKLSYNSSEVSLKSADLQLKVHVYMSVCNMALSHPFASKLLNYFSFTSDYSSVICSIKRFLIL